MADSSIEFYGFTAVPRDPEALFRDHPTALGENPKQDAFSVTDFPFPESELIRSVKDFVQVCHNFPQSNQLS